MVKLGQQLQQQSQSQGRVTRTQRVIYKQQVQKAEQTYAKEKAQANVVAEKLWKDVEYQEGGVTKTRPFTVEDYGNFLQNLSPELKKFFISKEQVVTKQESFRSGEKVKVQTELQKTQQSLADYIAKKQKEKDEYDKWFRELPSSERASRRSRYDERMKSYENDLDEKQAYYRGVIEKLNWGIGQLDKGDMLSSESIKKYAVEYGGYLQDREEGKNEAKEYNIKQIKAGNIPIYKSEYNKSLGNISGFLNVTDPSKKGYIAKENIPSYLSEQKVLSTKDVKYYEGLVGWTGKVGFEKISPIAQKIINPSAVEFQQKNPSEILKFDNFGNVTGVKSSLVGGEIVPIEQYNDEKFWQDYTIQDWKKNRTDVALPFKVFEVGKDLPKDYYIGQTIQTGEMGKTISPSVIVSDEIVLNKTSSLFSKLGKAYSYTMSKSGDIKIPFVGVGGSIKVSDITSPVKESLFGETGVFTKARQSLTKKDLEETGIQEKYLSPLEEKYQKTSQIYFDNQYMERLIRDEITFEEAEAEFEKSDRAKIIAKNYEQEYGEVFKEKRAEFGTDNKILGILPKFSMTQVKLAGLGFGESISKLAVGIIPETYGEAVVNTALIYSGTKILKGYSLLPKAVQNTAIGGFGAYGVYEYFSPKSSPEQRVMGVFQAGLSATILGYSALKYLKSPVVTRKVISPPKRTAVSTGAIGREKDSFLVKIYGDTKKVEKVYYGSQKLGQYSFPGSRAEVTTKWRTLSNKYFGTDFEPIYYGIPTKQLGYTRDFGLFRTTKLSGYDEAKNLLVKYGYSQPQAVATLRYIAPKYIEQVLENGKILISGNQAIGNFKYLTKQPVLEVDKFLGIKTRGAKTIRDTYNFGREIVGTTKGGNLIVLESGTKTTAFVTKEGASYNLLRQAGRTKTFYSQLSSVKPGDIYEALTPTKYKDVYMIKEMQTLNSAYVKKQLVPFIRKMAVGKTTSYLLKNAQTGELPILDFDKVMERSVGFSVSKQSPYSITPAKIKKTPFSSTFAKTDTVPELKKLINNILDNKVTTPTTTNVEGTFFSQSKYSGLGLYERTSNTGVLNIGNVQGTQALKFANIPQVQVPKMFDYFPATPITSTRVNSILGVGLLSALSFESELKLDNKLAMDLKADLGLKQGMGLKSQLKQMTSLKQVATPKPALSNVLETPPITTARTVNQIFNTPTPKLPIIPIIIGASKKQAKNRAMKERRDARRIKGLFPDFTARAIGLEPIKVSGVEGAMKEIKKLQTGFGIRRGIRIDTNIFGKNKRKNALSEKQLMRSVMA